MAPKIVSEIRWAPLKRHTSRPRLRTSRMCSCDSPRRRTGISESSRQKLGPPPKNESPPAPLKIQTTLERTLSIGASCTAYLQPTVQVEPERIRLITGHDVTSGLLLFHHKEHKLLIGHFLHGLRSRPVDLTAYPVILGVGVNAEFDGVVGGGSFGWICGCHGF